MLTFGEWQTTRRLTKFGHTGEVFEVRNSDGRRGALKHYLPTCPGTKETFLRERDFLASDDASDIKPELLDCGTAADGNPFFVMEWVETLSRSSFPLIRTMKEVAAACARLRDSGYYHCDLKPSNVGRRNGRIVLIDFGCIQRIPSALHGNAAARLWRKRIVYTLLALSAVALGYGLIAARNGRHRTAIVLEADWQKIDKSANNITEQGMRQLNAERPATGSPQMKSR